MKPDCPGLHRWLDISLLGDIFFWTDLLIELGSNRGTIQSWRVRLKKPLQSLGRFACLMVGTRGPFGPLEMESC
jgi:hypothetical protein